MHPISNNGRTSTVFSLPARRYIQTSYSNSISLHTNGHFPGGPELAGTRMSPFRILLELRMMQVVVTTGAIRRAKLQSNHRQQTNTQFFYRPDALPVASHSSRKWNSSTYLIMLGNIPQLFKMQQVCFYIILVGSSSPTLNPFNNHLFVLINVLYM